MGGASRQMHAKKKKQEKEAAEAAKKAEEEVKVKFNKNLKWPKMYLSCWKINILLGPRILTLSNLSSSQILAALTHFLVHNRRPISTTSYSFIVYDWVLSFGCPVLRGRSIFLQLDFRLLT